MKKLFLNFWRMFFPDEEMLVSRLFFVNYQIFEIIRENSFLKNSLKSFRENSISEYSESESRRYMDMTLQLSHNVDLLELYRKEKQRLKKKLGC